MTVIWRPVFLFPRNLILLTLYFLIYEPISYTNWTENHGPWQGLLWTFMEELVKQVRLDIFWNHSSLRYQMSCLVSDSQEWKLFFLLPNGSLWFFIVKFLKLNSPLGWPDIAVDILWDNTRREEEGTTVNSHVSVSNILHSGSFIAPRP